MKKFSGNLQLLPLLAASLAGFAMSSQGAILAKYSFDSSSMSSFDDDAGNLTSTASSLSNGAGVTSINSSTGNPAPGRAIPGSETASNTEAGAVDADDYLQFTLTPAAGYQLNLTTLSLDFGSSYNTQPRGFAIRSSLDGYTGTIYNLSLPANSDSTSAVFNYSTSLGAAQYQNLTDPVTFRIYAFDNATGTTSYLRFDNITLEGAVTAVPEPTGALLLGVAVCPLLLIRGRRKSQD